MTSPGICQAKISHFYLKKGVLELELELGFNLVNDIKPRGNPNPNTNMNPIPIQNPNTKEQWVASQSQYQYEYQYKYQYQYQSQYQYQYQYQFQSQFQSQYQSQYQSQFHWGWLGIGIGIHIGIHASMTFARANPNLPPIPIQLLRGNIITLFCFSLLRKSTPPRPWSHICSHYTITYFPTPPLHWHTTPYTITLLPYTTTLSTPLILLIVFSFSLPGESTFTRPWSDIRSDITVFPVPLHHHYTDT